MACLRKTYNQSERVKDFMGDKNVFESKRNNNVYHILSDRIVVYSGSDEREIPLPVDPTTFMYYLEFSYMFYAGDKLFVVVVTRGSYDARFELDEDNLNLKGPPIPTY